jgi:molybdate transport system ATP-binding protein
MKLILRNVRLPLARFDLELSEELEGRVGVLFGPSGAGKTSLLDLIAGLRQPKSAFIQQDGEVLTDTEKNMCVPTRRRGIGYVPQDLALFPHLSVRQNVDYGRKIASRSQPQLTFQRVVEVLDIGPLMERRVTDLSGGERQRVALARAILASPRLLLLDEPLASLDARLKARILPYLTRIRDEFHVPMLYVTHDRRETLRLADAMMVLVDGKVVQRGTVTEVFNRPVSADVAGLVNIETIQPGRVLNCVNGLITVAAGTVTLTAVDPILPDARGEVYLCIRAEDVSLLKGADMPGSPRNHLPATVRAVTGEGFLMRVDLDCGFPLTALLTRPACEELALKPGDPVVAWIKAPNVHVVSR